MISIIDAHEATLESIKYDDDIISDFLIRLFKDNLFKNTFIFLMRDHGASILKYRIKKILMVHHDHQKVKVFSKK